MHVLFTVGVHAVAVSRDPVFISLWWQSPSFQPKYNNGDFWM